MLDTLKIKIVTNVLKKILSVLSAFVCFLLTMIVLINLTLVIESVVSPSEPPNILGYVPIVRNASYSYNSPSIPDGALGLAKTEDTYNLQKGDTVAFINPKYSSSDVEARNNMLIGTIYGVNETNELQKSYTVQGMDTTSSQDSITIYCDEIVGKIAFSIPYLGYILSFVQKPIGIIICVGIPLLAFLMYDIIRRYKMNTYSDIDDVESLEKTPVLVTSTTTENAEDKKDTEMD